MKSIADVNVILPLILEQHSHRVAASAWWETQPDEGVIVTLPVRMAILRLLTNRTLMGTGVLEPGQAWHTLSRLTYDARAVVQHNPPAGLDALWLTFVRSREPTPNLWTDAWLAAFAEAENAEMVTFDKGFRRFPLSHLHL